ncbi:acyltransferase [Neorhizobium sp. LMR1-1-1.1]
MKESARKPIIENVQLLRFVAAFLVVIAHSVDLTLKQHPDFSIPQNIGNFGASGVDIFFVISGFIITAVATNSTKTPAQFGADRIKRVVPLYWIASLPWIIFALIEGTLWVRALFVTITFWPAVGTQTVLPVLPIGWTLCFELLFYFAICLFLLAGRSTAAAWGLVGTFALSWAGLELTDGTFFQFLGNPIILEFLFGVLIALLAPRTPRWTALPFLLISAFWFAATIAFGFGDISESHLIINGALSLDRVLLWGVPSALLVSSAVSSANWLKGISARTSVFLGDASYSTYLVHLLALAAVGQLSAVVPMAPLPLFIVAVVSGQMAGLICHLFLERPLRNYLTKTRPAVDSSQLPLESRH